MLDTVVSLVLFLALQVSGGDFERKGHGSKPSLSSLPLQIIPLPSLSPVMPQQTNLTILHRDDKKRHADRKPPPPPLLPRDAYVLTTTAAWSVVVPDDDNAENGTSPLPLERTLVQASQHHCQYATNGGPFAENGACVGAVVSNGRLVASNFAGSVGFGMGRYEPSDHHASTSQSQPSYYWVIGPVESVSHANELGLEQYVTGFDWLVYNGTNVAVASDDTGAEQAPRTAIGVTQAGHLLLFVADGCERCWKRRGLRLSELADVLIQRADARFAINLDGGSSSVLINYNRTVSRPTCLDVVPIVCERPVASVVCIQPPMATNGLFSAHRVES